MFPPLLTRGLALRPTLRTTSRLFCSKPTSSTQSQPPPSPSPNAHEVFRKPLTPSNFDKWMLVYTGRYKTKEEIPPTIAIETLEKAKNKTRIKMANYMMLATLVGCLAMVWTGKKAAERGESVEKMNLEWHAEMNRKADLKK